ncbi:MAG: D-glycero-beta-D-manno-heptose 1-phosphate adenylyltransferase [Planctomycetota bacterium]
MLTASLESLGKPRLLVIGDLILDEYVWGEVSRVSPEAPVPVLHAHHREFKAGGAGSVVENLAVLQAQVQVCGLIGDDQPGVRLRAAFERVGVDCSGLLASQRRQTTCKTRMMAYVQQAHRAQQQVLRLDWERVEEPDEQEEARIFEFVESAFADPPAAVLVSDYEKGLLTPKILQHIVTLGRKRGIPVLVDPGRSVDYSRYSGATLICPNRFESEQASGVAMRNHQAYDQAARKLLEELQLDHVALTLDRDGILLLSRDGDSRMFPTRVREVADVAGAGDMVLSLIGLAFGSGWPVDQAIELANLGAGVEVSKVGVAPVDHSELYEALANESGSSRVRRREDLLRLAERARASGQKIVFTNGCFDFIHVGHVELLQSAKECGDVLIVAVNTDESVRRLKGDDRPIHTHEERGRVLSAMTAIDHIVFFEEDTPIDLIEALRPDVLVKGADYQGGVVIGREIVEANGGRVELIPIVPENSTTSILGRIRRSK